MASDILLEDNGDFKVVNGDFAVDYSDDQHIDLIMRSNPGDIKDHPLLGIGIDKYLNSPLSQGIQQRISRDVRLHLQSDNAKNISVSFVDTLKIQATYED